MDHRFYFPVPADDSTDAEPAAVYVDEDMAADQIERLSLDDYVVGSVDLDAGDDLPSWAVSVVLADGREASTDDAAALPLIPCCAAALDGARAQDEAERRAFGGPAAQTVEHDAGLAAVLVEALPAELAGRWGGDLEAAVQASGADVVARRAVLAAIEAAPRRQVYEGDGVYSAAVDLDGLAQAFAGLAASR